MNLTSHYFLILVRCNNEVLPLLNVLGVNCTFIFNRCKILRPNVFIFFMNTMQLLIFFENLLKRYECTVCKKRFRKIEESMQHQQVIHGTGRSYTCNKCNLSFDGMEQMRDHIKKFHSYNVMKKK